MIWFCAENHIFLDENGEIAAAKCKLLIFFWLHSWQFWNATYRNFCELQFFSNDVLYTAITYSNFFRNPTHGKMVVFFNIPKNLVKVILLVRGRRIWGWFATFLFETITASLPRTDIIICNVFQTVSRFLLTKTLWWCVIYTCLFHSSWVITPNDWAGNAFSLFQTFHLTRRGLVHRS